MDGAPLAMPGKTDGEEDPRVKPVPLFTAPLPALPPQLSQRDRPGAGRTCELEPGGWWGVGHP